LYPQNEIGPSISSSGVLCVFVLLVYIVVLFKCANNFGSVFPDGLDRRIYETIFPTHASFFFFTFSISVNKANFSSMLKLFFGWM